MIMQFTACSRCDCRDCVNRDKCDMCRACDGPVQCPARSFLR
jgi:hypothetical protein